MVARIDAAVMLDCKLRQSELVRVVAMTIRYWSGRYKFIDWAIQEKHYRGPRYTFECIDPENLALPPRDAFDDEELLNLLKQPLFTKNRIHVWQPGGYFVHRTNTGAS